ncbi:MAG: hypothetical protein HGB03_00050 [Candidatus Yonathbacteria bacterium]|nr:hypothetical protein [Candidatus Yonathbacteria bacterium]NTW48072.1 hypothetical protein [Candidatus Yonathbacteria bacterium]
MWKRYQENTWLHYVDALREKADIVDVVRSEHIKIKKCGKDWLGCSPFNREQKPSFRVSQEKQIFKCFSTGKGGNVFTFFMEIRKCTFSEAVAMIAKMYHFGYVQWKDEKKKRPGGTEHLHHSTATSQNACLGQKIHDEDDDLPF